MPPAGIFAHQRGETDMALRLTHMPASLVAVIGVPACTALPICLISVNKSFPQSLTINSAKGPDHAT